MMDRLELWVNGSSLDLPDNTRISLTLSNPLLNAQVLEGGYTWTFSIPASPANRLALGFADLPATAALPPVNLPAVLQYSVLRVQGRLKVQHAGDDEYSVQLFTQIAAVADKLKSLRLSHLALPVIDLSPDPRPTLTLSFSGNPTGGPLGSLVHFLLARQSGFDVFVCVQWLGSTAQLVADLVDSINNSKPKYPPFFKASETYNTYNLVQDSAGDIWEAQVTGLTGITPDPLAPEWILVANMTTWRSVWLAGGLPDSFRYDDPDSDNSFAADFFEETLYLYDNSTGGSSMDYMDIWGQYGAIIAGYQTVDGSGNFANNLGIKILRMFDQAVSGTWETYPCAFFPVRNISPFDDSQLNPSLASKPYINYYFGGRFRYDVISPEKRYFSAFPYLFRVLHQLFADLGIELSDEVLLENPDLARLVVYSAQLAGQLNKAPGGVQYLSFPFALRLADHVPDISLGDFLNAVRNFLFWGFCLNTEGSQARIVFLKNVLAAPATLDWTEKVMPGLRVQRDDPGGYRLAYLHDTSDERIRERLPDLSSFTFGPLVEALGDLPTTGGSMEEVRLVRSERAYYRPIWNSDNTYSWQFIAEDLQSLSVLGGQTLWQPKVAPLLSELHTDTLAPIEHGVSNRDWLTPSVSQKLGVKNMALPANFSFRLAYYWGLQPDSLGQTYPMGSSGNTNALGHTLGYPALRWDGEEGLYLRYGRAWLDFLNNTRQVSARIWLTALDLKNLRADAKIRIDQTEYLWKTIRVSLPITGPAEVEVWKC